MRIGWTELATPRRLTGAEQAVLDRLVAHAGNAELTAQAAAAWVTALCDCGCGSLRLRSDAAALSPATVAGLSTIGRDDWFSIDCTYRSGDLLMGVVVHVVGGLLHELEIFAGEGVPVEVPRPEELAEITLM